VDYTRFVKKLRLPDGRPAPVRLTYDDVVAEAISRAHLRDDVAGINASLDLISRTRGGGWPTGPVTEEENLVDIVWHECEFRDGKSLTYVLYDAGDEYLGCCYLYPLGVRTSLTEDLLAYDVDASWWVTPDAYARGYYGKVHAALQAWLADEFPGWRAYYSNRELPARAGR
jgi:hypothetical protein